MADVKVVQGFTDKIEGVFRCVGDTFSCNKARTKELVGLGLVKELAADAPAPESTKDVKPKKKTTKTKK